MGRTVGELSAVLTTDELAHWYAMNSEAPLGDERWALEFARTRMLMAEVAGAKKTGGGAWSLDDFMLFKPGKPKSLVKNMLEFFKPLVAKKKKV